LLVEPGALALIDNDAAVDRAKRVIAAAQILGCSAAAISVEAPDTDEALAAMATRLRGVVERAEKLDLNLLIAPTKGLTERPERVTELLKKVGGFRIGTYPDFQTAARSSDAPGYLHRLSPYATVISASTLAFRPPEADPPAASKSGRGSRSKAEPAPAPTPSPVPEEPAPTKGRKKPKPDLDDDDPPKGGVDDLAARLLGGMLGDVGKGGKAKKGAKGSAVPPPPPPPPAAKPADDDDDEDDELEGGLEALMADLAELDEAETQRPPAPVHTSYDLPSLIAAVVNVGYEGPLSIDYRGTGDVTLGVKDSRLALEEAILALGGEM
jgi:hypothetical protein